MDKNIAKFLQDYLMVMMVLKFVLKGKDGCLLLLFAQRKLVSFTSSSTGAAWQAYFPRNGKHQ